MNAVLVPATIGELVEAVKSTSPVLAMGAGTKPRLSAFAGTRIALRKLSGIVEYEPSEFTFTALAGTPIRNITETLAQRGQYLPFDPMLSVSGATLGGTVAAGLSGPGRFRYGGLRDFILGVLFIDGTGRVLRMGGKVVKNAAGFDLPKFFVGSLGRFGVLAEITFKVFPRPGSHVTLRLPVANGEVASAILMEASRSRWELDALDASPHEGAVFLRLGGPTEANDALAGEILSKWAGEIMGEADPYWEGVAEFKWAAEDSAWFKVPCTPKQVASLWALSTAIPSLHVHISTGGNVAYLALPLAKVAELDQQLRLLGLVGLTLRGEAPLHLGSASALPIQGRVKAVLDPEHRFPSI